MRTRPVANHLRGIDPAPRPDTDMFRHLPGRCSTPGTCTVPAYSFPPSLRVPVQPPQSTLDRAAVVYSTRDVSAYKSCHRHGNVEPYPIHIPSPPFMFFKLCLCTHSRNRSLSNLHSLPTLNAGILPFPHKYLIFSYDRPVIAQAMGMSNMSGTAPQSQIGFIFVISSPPCVFVGFITILM